MPFLMNPTEEELKKQQSGQAPQISGQSTVIGDSSAPTGPQSPSTPKSSGQFTNIQSYLKANEGNMPEQTNKLTGYVDQSANAAQESANNYSNNVNKVDKVDEKGLQDTYYNDPGAASKESYNKLKANYSGPNDASSVQGYDDVRSKSTKAVNDVNALNGDVGQLNQTVFGNNKNYTGGANTLNSMLTQQDPNAQKQIQNTSTKWQGISDLLNGVTNAADTQIKTNKENTLANQNLIPIAEQHAMSARRAPVTQRTTSLNNEIANINPAINTPSQSLIDALGINSAQVNPSINLTNYFNPNGRVSEGNIATQGENQDWNNLMQLLGSNEQLGTVNDLGTVFDSAKFNVDNSAAQTAATIAKGSKLDSLPVQNTLVRPKGMSETDWQAYLASLKPQQTSSQPTADGLY